MGVCTCIQCTLCKCSALLSSLLFMYSTCFPSQKPPKAVGYPDDVTTLYSAVSVADFITSDKHLSLLANCSKLEFDRRSQVFSHHPLTTAEVRLLCEDVKVLGPAELRQLVSGCGCGCGLFNCYVYTSTCTVHVHIGYVYNSTSLCMYLHTCTCTMYIYLCV